MAPEVVKYLSISYQNIFLIHSQLFFLSNVLLLIHFIFFAFETVFRKSI